MPVTSNAGFVWPPSSTPVVSPDGVLSARVDLGNSGVHLAADWTGPNLAPSPATHADAWTFNGGAFVFAWDAAASGVGIRLPDDVSTGTGGDALGPFRDTKPGDVWAVSAYVGTYYGAEAANCQIRCYWYDAAKAYITSDFVASTLGSGAGVLSGAATAPTGAAYARIRVANFAPSGSGGWFSARDIECRLLPLPDLPQRVRFIRDGVPVRSGDTAFAPGGVAVAYDHEAPLNTGVSYHAVPIFADGSEGAPSDTITVEVAPPAKNTWLKSTIDPDLSMQSTHGYVPAPVTVEPVTLTRAGRVNVASIAGSRFPSATWDAHEAVTGQMAVNVWTILDRDRLLDLLDSGPILVQPPRNTGIDQFYALAGDIVSEIRTFKNDVPVTRISFSVTGVARPSTTDSPYRVPGLSYADIARDYETYKELSQQVPTYLALAGVDW